MHATSATVSAARPSLRSRLRWRVVDIVVASVIGVAVGIVYWAWGVGWNAISAPFDALLPGLTAGPAAMWVIGGVLGGLVIRKVGAAFYVELVAAVVSALVGTQWGAWTVESGIVQGLGAEIVFLIFAYRVWTLPVAILAGAGAGLAMAINDLIISYPGSGTAFVLAYVISALIGGAIIAGILAWLAVKGLASTGALSRFGSGREARVVER